MAVTIKGFASDWSVPTGAQEKLRAIFASKDSTIFFAKDHGVVADGVTDDSDALLALYNRVVTATVPGGIAGGNLRSRARIILPAGRILLTKTNVLMAATAGSRAMGYTIEGAGRSLTEIVWKPATAGTPLLRNNDVWMQVTLRGMTFISDTPGANFMHSSSNGGAQDYLFEECSWSGNWGYGLGLDGTGPTTANNNSEIEFRRCTFAGSYNTAFLWSGMTAGNTQQDQFLNFTFSTCNVVLLSGGTFGRWDYGGAIYFNDSNVMLDGGAQLFDLRGSSHANGAQLLKVDGGRAELRNDAVKILTCGWGRGNVVFNGWDEEANYLIVSQAVVTHSYNPASLGGPTVRYQTCAFSGRHEYAHGANSYTASRSITYDGCTLPTEPHTFIQITGASNPGGRAVITFRRTRSRANNPTGTSSVALDQTLGWWEGIGSQPERRSAVFRPSSATLHNTATVTLTVPRNAMVTAVRFYKQAGVGTSTVTNWSYRVESSETTPTVLATCAGEGTIQWAAGFSKTAPVENFVCNTDEKRALKLIPTSVPELATGIQGFVVVEYLA